MPGDGTLPALRLTHSHISSARPNVGPYTAIALENDALEDGRVPGPTSDDSGDDSCLVSHHCMRTERPFISTTSRVYAITDASGLSHSQAVASGNHVELLNDKLHLRSTLLFADAFPTSVNRDAAIRVLAADRANGRVSHTLNLECLGILGRGASRSRCITQAGVWRVSLCPPTACRRIGGQCSDMEQERLKPCETV